MRGSRSCGAKKRRSVHACARLQRSRGGASHLGWRQPAIPSAGHRCRLESRGRPLHFERDVRARSAPLEDVVRGVNTAQRRLDTHSGGMRRPTFASAGTMMADSTSRHNVVTVWIHRAANSRWRQVPSVLRWPQFVRNRQGTGGSMPHVEGGTMRPPVSTPETWLTHRTRRHGRA